MRRLVALSSVVLCLSGCGTSTPDTVPPRATDAIAIKPQSSLIAVPLSADLSQLTATLEREVPRRLWAIDKPGQVCVASDKVKVLFVEVKTPTIKCHIVGQVTRGRLSLSGSGHNLVLSMPVHAVIHARDIAGALKQETATADAQVQARIDLDVGPDWQPRGKVDLAYRWTAPPTVDFLGQKIDLSESADAKLKGVIAQLERTLPGQLGKLQLREQAQQAWNAGFTSLLLNRAHPPVWMRVTPQELQYGGYDITNNRLTLRLGLRAVTETFVGPRPANPTITPLPPLSRLTTQPGNLSFFIPVIADYRELQPVLLKALHKRQVRPFQVPGVGPVWARFNSATIYGTTGGRIAVGLNLNASDEAGTIGKARATVWMTAIPVNQPNSRQVGFDQFEITGSTDRQDAKLVLKLANAPGLSRTIAYALTQNFEKDFDKLLGKVDRAIQSRQEGPFVIRADIERVETGTLKAAGQGVYLPVRATGRATITLAPK